MITDAISSGGDSGAILVDEGRRAVGLLVGGSPQFTVHLPIEPVLDALGVSLVTGGP